MKLGIKNIFYIERKILTLPFYPQKTTCKLPTGLYMAKIPITHLSGEFNSTAQPENNGIVYDVNIKASLPYQTKNELLINRIESGDFAFMVEDMNRQNYLVGCNHFRAVLISNHIIDRLNKNVISFEIKHTSPHGELAII